MLGSLAGAHIRMCKIFRHTNRGQNGNRIQSLGKSPDKATDPNTISDLTLYITKK